MIIANALMHLQYYKLYTCTKNSTMAKTYSVTHIYVFAIINKIFIILLAVQYLLIIYDTYACFNYRFPTILYILINFILLINYKI